MSIALTWPGIWHVRYCHQNCCRGHRGQITDPEFRRSALLPAITQTRRWRYGWGRSRGAGPKIDCSAPRAAMLYFISTRFTARSRGRYRKQKGVTGTLLTDHRTCDATPGDLPWEWWGRSLFLIKECHRAGWIILSFLGTSCLSSEMSHLIC